MPDGHPSAKSANADASAYVDIQIESFRKQLSALTRIRVVDATMLSWMPASLLDAVGVQHEKRVDFVPLDGRIITRDTGYAIVHCLGRRASDEVVFAEPGDPILVGFRTLSGLNLRLNSLTGLLEDGGPVVAAGAA